MKSRDRKKSIANYFYFLFMPTKYSQIKVQPEDKDQIKSNATKVQPTGMDQNKDVIDYIPILIAQLLYQLTP